RSAPSEKQPRLLGTETPIGRSTLEGSVAQARGPSVEAKSNLLRRRGRRRPCRPSGDRIADRGCAGRLAAPLLRSHRLDTRTPRDPRVLSTRRLCQPRAGDEDAAVQVHAVSRMGARSLSGSHQSRLAAYHSTVARSPSSNGTW